ncbi:unnamed protein product, partial [Strongylus vulgaris]
STQSKVDRFVEKYITVICETEEFLGLSVDELCEILAIDELYAEEGMLCKAAVRWIEHDRDCRGEFLSRILTCIRLLSLDPSYLVTELARHPLIVNDLQCKTLVSVS